MKENKTINNIFNKLNEIQVGEFITSKKVGSNNLNYLSWTDAFTLLFKEYEEKDINYKIFYNDKIDDLPIFGNENIGYYVKTEITICGIVKQMILPVLDGANKPKKLNEYQYFVKDYKTQKPIQKTVLKIDMMDINTTVQRCLVKNIAIFGLGLSVYRGDDLSNNDNDDGNEAPEKRNTEPEVKKETLSKDAVIIQKAQIENDMLLDKFKSIMIDYKEMFSEDELSIYRTYYSNKEYEKIKGTIKLIETRVMKG
jgi:hypothetical protein